MLNAEKLFRRPDPYHPMFADIQGFRIESMRVIIIINIYPDPAIHTSHAWETGHCESRNHSGRGNLR